MASDQARRRAERLIREHERRKEELEVQRAREGYQTDPSVIAEIEDIDQQIRALKNDLDPPDDRVRRVEIRRGLYESDTDYLIASIENLDERQREDHARLAVVLDRQMNDSQWRETMTTMIFRERDERQFGQWLNRGLNVLTLLVVIAFFAFVLWRLG